MLCAPVLIFISGRSALLVYANVMVYRSDCHYLPYSVHFSEFIPNFFHKKTDKTQIYLKSGIFIWYKNSRWWLTGRTKHWILREFLNIILTSWRKARGVALWSFHSSLVSMIRSILNTSEVEQPHSLTWTSSPKAGMFCKMTSIKEFEKC